MKELPKVTVTDNLDAAARAAIMAAASAGGAASGLPPGILDTAVAFVLAFLDTPSGRRRNRWLAIDLADALLDLQRRVGTLEDFENNDAFLDTVFAATAVAIQDSNEKRRRALRNAVINVGLGVQESEARRRVLVRLIGELDEVHVLLLRFFADPHEFMRLKGITVESFSGHYEGIEDFINRSFRDFADQALFDFAIEDLQRRHLVKRYGGGVECRPRESFATSLGLAFLELVAEPPAL